MRDLVIFGADRLGAMACESLQGERNIVAFCDNKKEKQGRLFCGLPVYGFEELKAEFGADQIHIVIASLHYEEIARQTAGIFHLEGIFEEGKAGLTDYEDKFGGTYYSQWGEDLFVHHTIMEEKEDPNNGFYVDIGAYHPFRYSNTYFAYKKGWKGICVEPNPEVKELFLKYRERDICFHCGISDSPRDSLDYYMFEEPAYNGFFSEQMLKEIGNGSVRCLRKIKVPVYSLKEILKACQVDDIDYMSVDVECMELDVLKSNDWNKYRPRRLLIEQLETKNIELSPVCRYLENVGYEFEAVLGVTVVYKRR